MDADGHRHCSCEVAGAAHVNLKGGNMEGKLVYTLFRSDHAKEETPSLEAVWPMTDQAATPTAPDVSRLAIEGYCYR